MLGDLGTDVRRVGRLASGLWVDALKPGLVGAGGVALVTVVGDAAGGPLGAAPKLPLESAGGDKAEPVRARLRERVSSGLSPPSARLAGVAGHKFSFFPVAGWAVVLILPCGSDSVFGHGPSARAPEVHGFETKHDDGLMCSVYYCGTYCRRPTHCWLHFLRNVVIRVIWLSNMA